MAFLFGDLTPAPFTTNFLEELRDAIDFAASIAETDQRIVTADATRDMLRRRADEDAARLEALVRSVLAAADAADKGGEDSLVRTFAADVAAVMAARHETASAALTARLTEAIRALDAATLAARTDYFVLLEEYLLAHVPPSATQTLRIELVATRKDERRYVAELDGRSELGLDWSMEMTVPEETWKAPLRVDRIADGLALLAPQLTGLIKKEVKLKKQKLDRHFVTKVVRDDANLHVELRSEVGADAEEGYDITAALDGDGLVVVKVGEAGDVTLGAFDVAAEDKDALLGFASKLRAMTDELTRKRLVAASFDGLPFDGTNDEAQPRLVELVSRLVAKLAPAVDEIAARSRSQDELVLRVQVADARREEIFMPKARLREKLAPLDERHRRLFHAFATALDAKPPANVVTPKRSDAPPPVRSEVPPLVRRRSGNMQAVVVPVSAPVPVEPAAVAAPEPEPEPPPSAKTSELVATLKHIRGISKDGHLEEAFRQYAALFSSPAFSACPPDDQRQALKLMMFGKTPPSPSEEMRAAYRAAVPALQALVVVHRDPADYEMLGMAYVGADEPEKGSEIFKKALELERARNPASDLCGNLMRRVSQL
jgi:hypothetical protein